MLAFRNLFCWEVFVHNEFSGSQEEWEFAKWTWQKMKKGKEYFNRWNSIFKDMEAKNTMQVWKSYKHLFIYLLVHLFVVL